MPDFLAITFPDTIAYGALGGPKFKTTVNVAKSGKEKRNIDWSMDRGEWDVAQAIQSDDDYAILNSFFRVCRAKAYEFRFHDWSDDYASQQNLGEGNSVKTDFQCIKKYEIDSYNYTRYITKINPSTEDPINPKRTLNPWEIKVGATYGSSVLQVEGGGDDYTVNRDTGIITFNAGSIPTAGNFVFATFEFFCHVRFDVDHLLNRIEDYDINTWGNIILVEIKPDV